MHRFLRTRLGRSSVATVAAIACLAAAPASSGGAAPGAESHRGGGSGVAAGLAGTPIALASGTTVHGFDIGVGPDGTAYVGWIEEGNPRTIHSCTLLLNATACFGGEKSVSSLGLSASGLQVLPPEGGLPATLVWHHGTLDPGEFAGKIATATVAQNGTLSNGTDGPGAYNTGSLLTAERGPGGSIWVVMASGLESEFRILPGLNGTPKDYDTAWLVNSAKLAFTGAGRAVVVFDRFGPIDDKVRVVRQTDTGWSGVSAINGTWNLGGGFDVVAQGGVRLVASVNNFTYYPRIATWGGTQFGAFSLTGDKGSCPKHSHDLYADSSRRIADAYFECSKVTITNHPKAKKAAFVRFNAGGTPAFAPQIGTTPPGLGWVAWATLEPDLVSHRLRVAPIRLPALKTSKTVSRTFGKVTVTGPVSCLPEVQTTIGVSARGLNGWSVVSKTLKLDGAVHGTGLNGTQFPPNTSHTVSGTAKFKKGGQTRTLTASLSFKTCPDVAIL